MPFPADVSVATIVGHWYDFDGTRPDLTIALSPTGEQVDTASSAIFTPNKTTTLTVTAGELVNPPQVAVVTDPDLTPQTVSYKVVETYAGATQPRPAYYATPTLITGTTWALDLSKAARSTTAPPPGSTEVYVTLDSTGHIRSTQLPASSSPVSSVAGKIGVVTLNTGDVAGLAQVAVTGSYGDLAYKPVIPSSADAVNAVPVPTGITAGQVPVFDGTAWGGQAVPIGSFAKLPVGITDGQAIVGDTASSSTRAATVLTQTTADTRYVRGTYPLITLPVGQSPPAGTPDGTTIVYYTPTAGGGGTPAGTVVFAENFEAGVVGAAIATTNTSFDMIDISGGGALTVDSTAHSGTKAMKVVCGATAGRSRVRRDVGTVKAKPFVSFYMMFPTLPAAPTFVATVVDPAGVQAHVRVAATGAVQTVLASTQQKTTSATMTAGQWARIEWMIDSAATTQTVRVFLASNVNGTIPDEVQTTNPGGYNGAAAGLYYVGQATALANTLFYVDAFQIADTNWAAPLL